MRPLSWELSWELSWRKKEGPGFGGTGKAKGTEVLRRPTSGFTPAASLALAITRSLLSTEKQPLLQPTTTQPKPSQDDWSWKGRKGPGEGGSQASSQSPSGQHPGHHQACHPPPRPSWRSQAHLWPHLRRDPWRPQGLPRERHS